MMQKVYVREVGVDDVEALRDITGETFRETFAHINSEENMSAYIRDNVNIEKLTVELLNPGSSFYFAMADGKPAGYLKLNRGDAQTELKTGNGMEIERIYVLKNFLGLKVGQLLFDKSIEEAGKMNADYLWLGVWENNARAIQFYAKNGMVVFDKHLFRLGDDDQTDIMMKLDLRAFGKAGIL